MSCVVAPSTAGLASCDAWTAPTWTDKPDKAGDALNLLRSVFFAACSPPVHLAPQTYTVEVKSVQSVFTPRNIIWTGLRWCACPPPDVPRGSCLSCQQCASRNVLSALMALVPVVERYLVALEEATEVRSRRSSAFHGPCVATLTVPRPAQLENRGEQPPPVPFPDLEPVRKRAQASMARDLSVQLCRRTLEHVLFVTQPPRTAAKLLKGARCVASQ